jgi:3-phosphoshikimate 1-carboxyvinyltransferase
MADKDASLKSQSVSELSGEVAVPGDKSISHRAVIFASQCIGTTHISGLLESEDVLCTIDALKKMGVGVRQQVQGEWEIDGVGVGGLLEPEGVLDMGNSGTAARLLMGLVTPYDFSSIFDGDKSLRSRPMARVFKPLEAIGAEFQSRSGARLPVTVRGAAEPIPVHYTVPVPSAQVKSAVLLAALNTPGETTVVEERDTRDHTERMLQSLGADIKVNKLAEGSEITLKGYPLLRASDIPVPGDPSSAAFLVVAALITPKSEITIKGVCVNPTRVGLYETLKEMGASITFSNQREENGEEIADITAKHSPLHGVTVKASRAPFMIDEYPILSVAAAFAEGSTVMEGLRELRVKESDRLSAIAEGLTACGVPVREGDESLLVKGDSTVRGGGVINTHLDHRIAMSFLVLGMASKKPVAIDDGAMIATSFPNFVELMNGLGAKISDGK